MTVYVCPIKDIECGDHKVGWCDQCPKHGFKALFGMEYEKSEDAPL